MNTIAYQSELDSLEIGSLTTNPPSGSLALAELVYAETEQLTPKQELESHAHSCHELSILLRGVLRVSTSRTAAGEQADDADDQLESSVLVQPGEAILLPRGVVHQESPASDDAVLRVVIGVNWSGYDEASPLHLHDRGGRLHELAAWLSVERHSTFPRAHEYRRALAQSALAEFERLRFDASSAIEKRTRAYIMSRLSKHISLEDMAKNAGMSRHHFSRLYRRVTGQTPTEYLRSLRLERARHLIRTTPQPLKVVAAQVGLASEHHLSRLLRKSFGVGVRDLRGRSHTSSRPAAMSRPD